MSEAINAYVNAAATWSAITSPGDSWGGALRAQLGTEEALIWARLPRRPLPRFVHGPKGETGELATHGWRGAHQRWQLALERTLPIEQSLEELEKLGGRLIVPGSEQWRSRLDSLGYSAPAALWTLGSGGLPPLTQPTVAIVGGRAATA